MNTKQAQSSHYTCTINCSCADKFELKTNISQLLVRQIRSISYINSEIMWAFIATINICNYMCPQITFTCLFF